MAVLMEFTRSDKFVKDTDALNITLEQGEGRRDTSASAAIASPP